MSVIIHLTDSISIKRIINKSNLLEKKYSGIILFENLMYEIVDHSSTSRKFSGIVENNKYNNKKNLMYYKLATVCSNEMEYIPHKNCAEKYIKYVDRIKNYNELSHNDLLWNMRSIFMMNLDSIESTLKELSKCNGIDNMLLTVCCSFKNVIFAEKALDMVLNSNNIDHIYSNFKKYIKLEDNFDVIEKMVKKIIMTNNSQKLIENIIFTLFDRHKKISHIFYQLNDCDSLLKRCTVNHQDLINAIHYRQLIKNSSAT